MVNRGPSLGCKRCRNLHKVCDKVKPACGRCVTAGISCPGYRDTGGVVFKDVTGSIVSKEERRAKKPKISPRVVPVHSCNLTLTTPRIDAVDASIHFFFDKYAHNQGLNLLISRGHFDHLPALYGNAAPNSALALATGLMSARAMFLYHGSEQMHPTLVEQELAANRALQAALKIEQECTSDETLLAVLCMDFAEHEKSRGTGSAASQAHTSGAVALIRGRGANTFQSHASRSLLAAAMSNVLHRVLWSDDARDQAAIMMMPAGLLRGEDMSPAIEIHERLLEVLKLQAASETMRDDHSKAWRTSFVKKSRDVHRRLLRWVDRLPSEWQHISQLGPSKASEPTLMSSIPDMQVAYLFSMWYCTRLTALRLFCFSNKFLATESQGQTPSMQEVSLEANGIINSLQAIMPCFLDATFDDSFNPGGYGELLERNASGVVLSCTGNSTIYTGGSPRGPDYLLNLLHWVVSLVEEGTVLARESIHDIETVKSFQGKLRETSLRLGKRSARSCQATVHHER